jgi:hypothetical protein
MTVSTAIRPAAGEYAPYYDKYLTQVTEASPVQALENQLEDMKPLLQSLTETQGGHRYAPGKWTIKQVLGHLIDCERVFAYRALRFARADRTELPGFEENDYAENGGYDRRPLKEIADELLAVRQANLALFRGLDDAAWTRSGIANGSEMSVRAVAFVIAGHGRHHVKLLRERYLSGAAV